LGDVISALSNRDSRGKVSFVPFRDSKLTHLLQAPEREFFIDNLLVRINFIIVIIRWTGFVPWEFEFPFPGSLASTFLTPGITLNPSL